MRTETESENKRKSQEEPSHSPPPPRLNAAYREHADQVTQALLLQVPNDRVRRISRNDLRVMQHVELLRRVPAGIQQDRLLSSRVIGQEGSDVEDLTVHDDPDVVFLVVLGDILEGEDFC